ncbi:MAG: tRNA uridine-5-carboxymethylaminomethyl(34) synthesis GTPase MnmE [Bacteroidales bacterium]|nr:tRNA uridine-5-carboxymethylaminomethyl(34) synthesis GTPase MnmE [Bacteroidales bacterium]
MSESLQSPFLTDRDTICAISTAPGVGGIAVIRVSGKEAIAICDKVFRPLKGEPLSGRSSHTLCYGTVIENGNSIDDVVVSVFRAPHSFTGEDTIELSCHGSLYIQQQLLQLLIKNGCRAAQAGEFTQRAFLNGKMDLSQAEAVADLIASTSSASHRLALSQLRGGFSQELKRLRDEMLTFTSLIELELDFSEEDVEFADRTKLHRLSDSIAELLKKLVESFKVGNAIKNGIPVAIIGETNAGKSTLLNLLLKEEKAIVSDIHGTTRDVIEDTVVIGGVTFRFIDTAGIRETTDVIESLGIERTFQKIEQAAIVLWVVDANSSDALIGALSKVILPRAEGKELVLLLNKCDVLSEKELAAKLDFLDALDVECLAISAKEQTNIDRLEELLLKISGVQSLNESDIVVTNIRHYEALSHAYEAVLRVQEGLQNNISGDFLSQDIREAIHYIGEIVGEITTDEVLGSIFSRFCIGK